MSSEYTFGPSAFWDVTYGETSPQAWSFDGFDGHLYDDAGNAVDSIQNAALIAAHASSAAGDPTASNGETGAVGTMRQLQLYLHSFPGMAASAGWDPQLIAFIQGWPADIPTAATAATAATASTTPAASVASIATTAANSMPSWLIPAGIGLAVFLLIRKA